MSKSVATCISEGIQYSVYKCSGATIILQHGEEFAQAYLLHQRFSRDVYRLMEHICGEQKGVIFAETRDNRMVRFMQRLGFSLLDKDGEIYKLEFIGE